METNRDKEFSKNMSRFMSPEEAVAHQSKMHGSRPALLKPVHVGKAPSAIVIGLCREHRIPAPLAEVEFHPLRKWRFDLCWPDQKIALEIDGGAFSNGRHVRGAGFQEDCRKLNAAVLLGFRVLRYPPNELAEGISAVASLMLVTQ